MQKTRIYELILQVLLIVILLPACDDRDGTEFSRTNHALVEVAGTRQKSSFSGNLKTIGEPPLEEFDAPVVYRFWFYGTYHYKVLTLCKNSKGKTFAYFYSWNGASPSSPIHLFKKWKCELSSQKTAQAMELIETNHFWDKNESVKIPIAYLNTGAHLYEIEGKQGKKSKIAFCNTNQGKDFESDCLNLCKAIFELTGEK